jgi:hypothetical protein
MAGNGGTQDLFRDFARCEKETALISNSLGTTSWSPPGMGISRSSHAAESGIPRGSRPECRLRFRTDRPATVPADHPPRQCQPAPVRFYSQNKSLRDHEIWSEPLPMICLEAKNHGAFWGAAFRKSSTLRTESLRVPAERFLHFWNRPLPLPCQTHPGEGGSSRVIHPSTRRVPPPPGQEEEIAYMP